MALCVHGYLSGFFTLLLLRTHMGLMYSRSQVCTGRAVRHGRLGLKKNHVVVNLVLNVVCDSVKKKEKYIKGVSY